MDEQVKPSVEPEVKHLAAASGTDERPTHQDGRVSDCGLPEELRKRHIERSDGMPNQVRLGQPAYGLDLGELGHGGLGRGDASHPLRRHAGRLDAFLFVA